MFARDKSMVKAMNDIFRMTLPRWSWKKELLIYTWTLMIIFGPFLFA